MYLRASRFSCNIYRVRLRVKTSQTAVRAIVANNLRPFEPFHPTVSRFYYHGRAEERRTRPIRSSIRPIWLFAICIPLGYILSWTLKSSNGEAQDTDGFVKYTLADKQEVSSTSSVFTLKPATGVEVRMDDASLKRVVTSVQFKQPQLQIARSYTLLPPTEDQDPRELRFLIRKERDGEVSGYLHRLSVGSELELRGLSAEYVLPENVDTVLFLAGGTGIAPAMQVANALTGEASVHIMWANRRREDCAGGISDSKEQGLGFLGWRNMFGSPSVTVAKEDCVSDQGRSMIITQLNELKERSCPATWADPNAKLLVDYFVDDESTFIRTKDVLRLIRQKESSQSGKKILFVAGPDGFVSHWAAGKRWLNGQEVQGPLGGILATMDLRGWEVVKL